MNIEPVQGKPLSDEQKQMVALMQELRKDQIGFLDKAGKRFVELTTGLLGVLFAVTAFGDKFPPPYLVALLFFLSAMAMGMRAAQPRTYAYYEANLMGCARSSTKSSPTSHGRCEWRAFFSGSGQHCWRCCWWS